MKIFAVIHYGDGCQKFFRTREAAETWIKEAESWYGEEAPFDYYISEGELSD